MPTTTVRVNLIEGQEGGERQLIKLIKYKFRHEHKYLSTGVTSIKCSQHQSDGVRSPSRDSLKVLSM